VSEHPIIPQFLGGSENGVGEKIALILKGLPPSHHLIGKSHNIINDYVTCAGCGVFLDGIVKCHIEDLENKFGKLNAKLFALQIWLVVSTLVKRLFTPNQRRFPLILICEGSQIFVWRNKAFIFFQKSDILFLHKTRIG